MFDRLPLLGRFGVDLGSSGDAMQRPRAPSPTFACLLKKSLLLYLLACSCKLIEGAVPEVGRKRTEG